VPRLTQGDIRGINPPPQPFLSRSVFFRPPSAASVSSQASSSRLYPPVRRSLHFLCLFRVSAAECHNFRESLRFGRRWVETRMANPHQTNRLQKTCRESWRNPRPPPPLSVPRLRRAFNVPQRFPFVARLASSVLRLRALPVSPPFPYFITARCSTTIHPFSPHVGGS